MKSFTKGFESSSGHWFKCIEKSSVDSQFENNTVMVRYKQDHKVTNKIYFMHQFNFLCKFYQSMCPIPIQNNMHWRWIEIKEIPKYKLYGNIGDLSKTTFWYHRNDAKRNAWVMCAHIARLMINPTIYTLPFTFRLYSSQHNKRQCSNRKGISIFRNTIILQMHNYLISTLVKRER